MPSYESSIRIWKSLYSSTKLIFITKSNKSQVSQSPAMQAIMKAIFLYNNTWYSESFSYPIDQTQYWNIIYTSMDEITYSYDIENPFKKL
jgi:hypothetical protein